MSRSVMRPAYAFAGALVLCSPAFGLVIATTTSLTTSPNPSIFGMPVTLTATVSPGDAPSGEVFFYDGATVLGVSPLAGGTATLEVSLTAAGNRSFRAFYGGGVISTKFLTTIYSPSTGSIMQTVKTQPAMTFLSAAHYPADSGPIAVAVGEFNGDGKPDLAVANNIGTDVSILLGNGDGTFQTATNYSLGNSTPTSVAVGDFNGDGKVDLAVVAGMVFVMLGNGNGTFQPAVGYSAGVMPYWVTVADFNADGKADLAVANDDDSGGVSILLGNGNGTFKMPVFYATDPNPTSVAAGDFNGDGKLDLVVATPGGNDLSVLLGKGDGTFQPAVSYNPGVGGGGFVTIGDFNGDGRLDLALGSSSLFNSVSVMLGNGDGTFQTALLYPVDSSPTSLAAADFNGDGKADLAVANLNGYDVSVLLGKGDGTFLAPVNFTAGYGPTSIAAADFDGDGKPDMVVANLTGADVSILLGDGNGTFQAAADYIQSDIVQSSTIASGDFNGDGKTDLAIADNQGVGVLLGAGNGRFQSPVNSKVSFTDNFPSSVAVADLNGDGIADLALTVASPQNAISILLGKGDGTFLSPLISPVGNDPVSVSVGDFNGDGSNDLAVVNHVSNTVSVLIGNGDGTFHAALDYAVSTGANAIVVGDFNKDGRADLAVAADNGSFTVPTPLSVLLGNGDGTFQAAVPYLAGMNDRSVAVGDFNGDGNADLAVAAGGEYRVYILLGKGDGTFQAALSQDTGGTAPGAVVVGDFDGDGKHDLAVLNEGGGDLAILIGGGDGTFEPRGTFVVSQEPVSFVVGQFNGDGRSDLAVADGDFGRVTVLLGIGAGADLRIVKSHSGSFAQGQTGATYVITVSNGGTASTSGTVAVTDTLPAGLTATALAGSGWLCNLGSVTCTRSNALAPGVSYPAITLTVSVSGGASSHLLNRAIVSGGGSTPATAGDVTNIAVVAASMTANAGTTPQSAIIGAAFVTPLAVTVKDAGSNPVSGVNVTFTAPASGASGLFSNSSTTITVSTNVSGIASAAFTANTVEGGPYTATAAAAGLTTVNFSLTNTGVASTMTANAGTTPQSATIGSAFATAVAVTVKDAGSNPVSGVNVTFTAPASGASGLFSNSSTTIVVPTNASGIASAPFTANGTAGGPYTVTAAATGLASVNFSLTNTAATIGVPSPVSVSPAAGSGASQTFTFTFQDSAGYADLKILDVLTSTFLDGETACYLAFLPSSATAGTVYLVDDAGDAGGPFAGALLINGSSGGSINNSQCTISASGSSVSASGNTLTLNLAISFAPGWSGNKAFYIAARTATQNSGWEALGTWDAAGALPSGPEVGTTTPAHSATTGQTYTFTFTDSKGYADLSVLDVLTGSFLDGTGACYFAYAPTSATNGYLYLVDDAGDGGYAPGSPIALSSGATLQNSQCTLSTAGSSASGSGNTLTLNLPIAFKPAFAGNQVFFEAARNKTTGNSGWQAAGSVTVP